METVSYLQSHLASALIQIAKQRQSIFVSCLSIPLNANVAKDTKGSTATKLTVRIIVLPLEQFGLRARPATITILLEAFTLLGPVKPVMLKQESQNKNYALKVLFCRCSE